MKIEMEEVTIRLHLTVKERDALLIKLRGSLRSLEALVNEGLDFITSWGYCSLHDEAPSLTLTMDYCEDNSKNRNRITKVFSDYIGLKEQR